MPAAEDGTMFTPLRILSAKGVRYSTIIDVGCADGHFCLNLLAAGLAPGAVPLNIDANAIYRESLEAIRDTVGGQFRICAVTDHEGEVELGGADHPYWGSLRPDGDLYWQRLTHAAARRTAVAATTLDALCRELAAEPPYLLKLDVQGAEAGVLRGAEAVLEHTHVVICEADVDDFQGLNAILLRKSFSLYDVTHLGRVQDGTLGWFYPVYVSRALDFARPKAFWDPKDNERVVQMQVERRAAILKENAEMLARIRNASRPAQPAGAHKGRNLPCPCGSGRKYKHCCGALR